MEIATTISTCTASIVRGRHFFQISDYSLNKGMGVGHFIRSKAFNIGGYDWSIRYYPDGSNRKSKKYISVFLELMSKNSEVRVVCGFRLATPTLASDWKLNDVPKVLSSESIRRSLSGWEKFMERSTMEGSELLMFDRLVIECIIIIVKDPLVLGPEVVSSEINVPSSELSNDFGKLLDSKEGADVTFFVKGEAFPAHKIVLAARSPVLKVDLCGPMMEKEASCITVEEMEPDVFRVLLRFIYTDALPRLDDFEDNEKKEMIHHLLGAADRYAIERLKLVCESILCKNLDVETVATTLALADQHRCNNLKDACLKFMVSPNRMDKVMASQEYECLKRKHPNLLVEVLESVCKFPKIYCARPSLI